MMNRIVILMMILIAMCAYGENDESRLIELDEELAALEKSISLQEEKLQVLRSMRQLAAAGVRIERNASCEEVARLGDALGCQRKQENRRGSVQSSRRGGGGYGVRDYSDRPLPIFDTSAHELFEHRTNDKIKMIAVLTFRIRAGIVPEPRGRRGRSQGRPRAPVANLIAVAYMNGTFALFDRLGQVVMSLNLPFPVLAVAQEGGPEDVTMALASTDNIVRFYELAVFRDGRLLAGRRWKPRQRPNDTVEHDQGVLGLSVVSRPLQEIRASHNNITAIGLTSRRGNSLGRLDPENSTALAIALRHSYLITGSDAGSLELLHRGNGSVLRAWHFRDDSIESQCVSTTQNDCISKLESITSITRLGSQLLVAHGPMVSYVSTSKWKPTVACGGGRGLGTVTAFAVDAFSTSIVHIAYDDGRILVYRAKSGTEQQKSSCRVMHQLQPPNDKAKTPTAVAAISRGFIATAAAGKVSLFNTTFLSADAPPRLIASRQFTSLPEGVNENNDTNTIFHLAASSPALIASASEIIFVHATDVSLNSFESILKYDPQGRDVAWMRMPIILVGLVVVFGYQLMKKNGPAPNRRFGSPGGGMGAGGTPDFGGAEMQRILEQMGRGQPGGGGLHSHRD